MRYLALANVAYNAVLFSLAPVYSFGCMVVPSRCALPWQQGKHNVGNFGDKSPKNAAISVHRLIRLNRCRSSRRRQTLLVTDQCFVLRLGRSTLIIPISSVVRSMLLARTPASTQRKILI